MKNYFRSFTIVIHFLLVVLFSAQTHARHFTIGIIDWQPYANGIHYLIPQKMNQNGSRETIQQAIQNYMNSIKAEPKLEEFANFGPTTQHAKILYADLMPKSLVLVANAPKDHVQNPARIHQYLESFGLSQSGHAYVIPVGAALRLNPQEEFEFHQAYAQFTHMMVPLGGSDLHSDVRNGDSALAVTELHHGAVNLLRDQLEYRILNHYISYGFGSLLGVCRGHQIINAILHGKLYEDIRTEIPEAIEHLDSQHSIRILPTRNRIFSIISRAKISGELDVDWVHSIHHMGVKESPYLDTAAISADGMIEASELMLPVRMSDRRERSRFILTVQFHAESPKVTGKFGPTFLKRAAHYSAVSFRPPIDIERAAIENYYRSAQLNQAPALPNKKATNYPDCIKDLLNQSQRSPF